MKTIFIGLMCIFLTVDLVNRMCDFKVSKASVFLNLAVLCFGVAALLWG